jgi:hypothetical protein
MKSDNFEMLRTQCLAGVGRFVAAYAHAYLTSALAKLLAFAENITDIYGDLGPLPKPDQSTFVEP